MILNMLMHPNIKIKHLLMILFIIQLLFNIILTFIYYYCIPANYLVISSIFRSLFISGKYVVSTYSFLPYPLSGLPSSSKSNERSVVFF